MSDTIPIVVNASGPVPQTPADLRTQVVTLATAESPGLTANLPASMVEDLTSTEVAAVSIMDSAVVELINSLTPYAANAFLLNQLGQIYGTLLGVGSTTSVLCVFSGPPGYVIAKDFTVSDGTFQYQVVDGGVINTSGTTSPLFCLATTQGSWVVPLNTVTNLVTSVPTGVTITVTNPTAGTPGAGPQTEADYRVQVLQDGQAVCQGLATQLRRQLALVSGVQTRLISPIQSPNGGWEILVGGGDPLEVGYAIYTAIFDISTLVGSTLTITEITKANPGIVTTNLNHGFTTGQVINISGVTGMTEVNNIPLTITVIDEKTFSIGENTTTFSTYISGGIVTPNLRNIVTSIIDYPDTYQVPFVNPPQQIVSVTLTWNTSLQNFLSGAAVAQLGAPAIVNYINSIVVGTPINVFELQNAFQEAVVSLIPTAFLTRMIFAISINGIGTAPETGTGIIAGDPESYFFTTLTNITITQG